MENLKIEILNPKSNDTVVLSIVNNDINFSDKIISRNILLSELRYKIVIERLNEIECCIRSKYISKFPSETREREVSYSPYDLVVNVEDLDKKFLYKLRVYLIEKLFNGKEDVHKVSNFLYVNPNYGLITEEILERLNRSKYKTKKIYSLSEKDNMKAIELEMKIRELDQVLDNKTIKNFTLENRNCRNLNEFTNTKSKFSKKMSDTRMKKVLYSTNSKLFFENLISDPSKETALENKNPFLKNEWFMGPIYSYDDNYTKLFK